MEKKYEVCELVDKYLRDNLVFAEVYPYYADIPVIEVEIHWGDWKHEHARAKWLLEEVGIHFINSIVTEDNGSDAYSAIHRFYIGESKLGEVAA